MKKKKKNFGAVGWKSYCSRLWSWAGAGRAGGARGAQAGRAARRRGARRAGGRWASVRAGRAGRARQAGHWAARAQARGALEFAGRAAAGAVG